VAGQVKASRSGARIVELFMPFEYMGMQVNDVALGPITLDHTLRYNKAEFKSWFEFMVEVSSVNNKPVTAELLRQLRYPDADRVVMNFIEILPTEIKTSVAQGMWPTREPVGAAPDIDKDALLEEFRQEAAASESDDDQPIPDDVDPLNVDA
jgi:hypothetical protein